MKPRYISIKDFDILQGEGVNVSLWLQGCVHMCEGCHNPETWDLSESKGFEFNLATSDKIINLLNSPIQKNLSILGGEPLLERNLEMLEILLKRVKDNIPSSKIWIWTGYLFEEICHLHLIKYVDVIVDGKYEIANHEISRYKGSSNQRVIDIKQSLAQNKIILYEGE